MSEKDQEPTPTRLREARRKGEVVFSADVASTVVFGAVVVAAWALAGTAYSLLRELWLNATGVTMLARPDERFPDLLLHTAEVLLWGCVPITVVAAVAGMAGSILQVGGLAAWVRLKPDLDRLNPAEGMKRLFSMRNLINLVKMVVKTLLLGLLMFVVIRSFVDPALRLGYGLPATAMGVGGRAILVVFAWAGVIYAVMAMVDYAHQHHEFMKQQRMSIDEVRREYKEHEGDPINSARRRTLHFEMVYAGLGDRVRAASAVIHSARVAVALQYLGDRDLPRVIARGEGAVAAQIRRLAGEALVPMAFDPHLAEQLHDTVPEDQPIPRALYGPVARLLRWAQGNT